MRIYRCTFDRNFHAYEEERKIQLCWDRAIHGRILQASFRKVGSLPKASGIDVSFQGDGSCKVRHLPEIKTMENVGRIVHSNTFTPSSFHLPSTSCHSQNPREYLWSSFGERLFMHTDNQQIEQLFGRCSKLKWKYTGRYASGCIRVARLLWSLLRDG